MSATETAHDQPSTSGGCLKMIGCGCLTLVLVTLIGGVYLYMNFHVLVAGGLESEIDRQMDGYHVPAQVQAEVLDEMSAFTDKIRNKELPAWEAFANLFASIEDGIAIPAVLGHYQFVGTYIDDGGLTADEQPAAKLSSQRFLRGVIEGTIARSTAREIAERLESKLPDGSSHQPPKMRDDIQPAEIRTIIDDMRQAADAAGVPHEPYNPDLPALVRQQLQSIGVTGSFESSAPPAKSEPEPLLKPSGETF